MIRLTASQCLHQFIQRPSAPSLVSFTLVPQRSESICPIYELLLLQLQVWSHNILKQHCLTFTEHQRPLQALSMCWVWLWAHDPWLPEPGELQEQTLVRTLHICNISTLNIGNKCWFTRAAFRYALISSGALYFPPEERCMCECRSLCESLRVICSLSPPGLSVGGQGNVMWEHVNHQTHI